MLNKKQKLRQLQWIKGKVNQFNPRNTVRHYTDKLYHIDHILRDMQYQG